MATASDQTKLKSQKTFRSSIKGQMTKIITYVNSNPDANDIDGFTTRLKRVKELLQQFCETEQIIFELDPEENPQMPEFSESFYHAEAKLSRLIREYNADSSVANATSHNASMIQNTSVNPFNVTEIRLPKLELPEFHGEYRKWLPFYDFFVKTIHENQNLSSVQKFKYLKGALKGAAESLLRHVSITDANYTESFNKLCQRFDRKRYIINDFVENFCNQPRIKIASAENIRELMDTSDETLRGLKSLGREGESRDPWLLHILVNKLDEETRVLWAQESAQIEFPTTQEFLNFLLKRFDTLESLRTCTRQSTKDHSKTTKTYVTNSNSNANLPICWLCEKSNHRLYDCTAFLNMMVMERRQLIKSANRCYNCLNSNHAVYQCSSKRRCSTCSKKHHNLLHTEPNTTTEITKTHLSTNRDPDDDSQSACSCKIHDEQPSTSNFHASSNNSSALIPTAMVHVVDSSGIKHEGRVLLDSGSLTSFVSENFLKKLNIPRRRGHITVEGLGNTRVGTTKGVVDLCLKSIHNSNECLNIRAYVVKKIASRLPEVTIDRSRFSHITDIELADPQFHISKNVDILLNVQHFFDILRPGQRKGKRGHPIAQETSFGWVIGGELDKVHVNSMALLINPSETNLDQLLKRFWEIEEIQTVKPFNSDELKCEERFKQDKTMHNGHFQVKLLFRDDDVKLGDSYNLAAARLRAMERRFTRDKSFKEMYVKFMMEYEDLGHMRQVQTSYIDSPGYLLPHHGVIKSSSTTTKLRVVFDASAKSSNGFSLNDYLLVGPTVQSSLYDILLRYRRYQFVFCADIEKMYRQVYIHPDHHHFQRILWRSEESQSIKMYELTTVTYGTACAPFLATRVLKQVAIDNMEKYPIAADVLKKDVYVDDLMSGANSIEKASKLQREINDICTGAGFILRKWVSNKDAVLTNVPESDYVVKEINGEKESAVKVLGLHWDPNQDVFCFKVNLIPQSENKVTKRILLSEVSKIFDPIGWLSPCIIRLKILFQLLWLKPLKWDEELPNDIRSEWLKMRSELSELELIRIPRWLQIESDQLELHGFCDASKNGYAAAIYARVKQNDGQFKCNLVTAKSRVAPIKQLTLAKLELCGALMLANLMQNVIIALEIPVSVRAWTDSTIVLDWLSDFPKRWPTFIGNRTAEILQIIPRQQWGHVSSHDNPADCASRGITPTELKHHALWWSGPPWIIQNEEAWPQLKHIVEVCKNTTSLISSSTLMPLTSSSLKHEDHSVLNDLIEKFSDFHKLITVVCYVLRVVNRCKGRDISSSILVSSSELQHAMEVLCREVQNQHFQKEIRQIEKKQFLNKSSLKFLNPFLDNNEILRVGGRIKNANIPYNVKHPIILPSNAKLTKLIIQHHHTKYYHADVTLLVSLLRQQFWIIRCKNAVRNVVHKCVKCFRARPKLLNQMMGDLPLHRVTMSWPFSKVGVDYAGPINIYYQRSRGQKSFKAYICLFVCMSTKAVHIELVQNLTTDAFLASLKRLVSRRGHCTDIYSDCGSNFVGANNQLIDIFRFLKINNNVISKSLLKDKIQWHFNPPSAPHMGGLWESAIKSTKYHLTRVIGDTILTIEEFQTLLVEIEGILNSRPLCMLSEHQLDALTPAHLIIGRPITQLPEPDLKYEKVNKLKRWEHVQFMKQHFWNRWHKEYLTSLQRRNKWLTPTENLVVGDVVIIKDDNLPSTQWRYGLIIQVHPGSDNLTRVATVKVESGSIQRPIHKLCKLPTQ